MPDALDEVLRQAQDLGLFGPGSMADQRRHAERICALALAGLDDRSPPEFLDLGSGGGLPGLVLARGVAGVAGLGGTLLDSRRRSTDFLLGAVEQLALTQRIEVVTARAEDAARDPARRERYGLVVARGFGRPAVTAECAVGFLGAGARLVVSEPPEPDPTRWDEAALAELGFTTPDFVATENAHAVILHRTSPLDPLWPRKRGIPNKRPLW